MPLTKFIRFKHNDVAVRAYLHSFGFEEAYGSEQAAFDEIGAVVREHERELGAFSHIVAALWGLDGSKMIDCAAYQRIPRENWPSNPSRSTWVFQNGIYLPATDIPSSERGCEDTDIALGEEGKLRRRCNTLEEYLSQPNALLVQEYRPKTSTRPSL